eukprot:CAMPEP_0172152208 /NCGR_PEP_ID=MMETSP1050-20130122/703_1 /TAXON_ID=233186 /ORGANISM="Cryptomonas curvata, Strain CCAP979/52" /LENGTH=52 /DNA_ID=CAMNT_0012820491 /DNA_START=271 /DNA_END=425 /DNA_ORIENTATION=-
MTMNPGAAVFEVQRRAPAAREKRRDARAGKRTGTKMEPSSPKPAPAAATQPR